MRTGHEQAEGHEAQGAHEGAAGTAPGKAPRTVQRKAEGAGTAPGALLPSPAAPPGEDPFGVHLLGTAVQRKPSHTTEDLHGDLYGDSSWAHGTPGGGGKQPHAYLVNALTGSAWPWDEKAASKVPTMQLVHQWLDYHGLGPTSPVDKFNLDACRFNHSVTWTIDKVADAFVRDATAAGYPYDRAVVRDVVVNTLRPKQSAAWANDWGKTPPPPALGGSGDAGTGPGTGGAHEPDTSTKVEMSWTYTPATVKSGGEHDLHTAEVAGKFTLQLHKDGNAGFDLSAGFVAEFAPQKGGGGLTLQKLGPVVEGAWVQPLIHDLLELQIVAQVLVAHKYEPGKQVGDKVTSARLGGPHVEPSLSPQLIFTVPGTGKALKVIGGGKLSPEGVDGALQLQFVKEF